MPKEQKKRGRREEKKRKYLEEENEPEAHTKRQKSEEQDDDQAIPLGDDLPHEKPVDNNHIFEQSSGPVETPFYGLLDDGEQAYFKQADTMLELNQFVDPEERNLFVANVYREANGKELKIANSQSCSRLMERMIRMSTPEQLKMLFGKFKEHFLHLVGHRFASHCCEALFLQAAPIVTEELIAPEELKKDEESGEVVASMETLFLETIAELQEHLGFLLTDQFSSHVLRVLLVVLSGRPLASAATASILQSKKKEKIEISNQVTKAPEQQKSSRTIPLSFTQALDEMISGTTAGLDTNYLRALATHPLGNPVLQLLLEIEFSTIGKRKAKEAKSLFRKLIPDEVPEEGTTSASFIKGLLYDPVGSRLLETIVQFSPGKTFKAIYRSLFRDKLNNLVTNDIAGFVAIKILERLSHDDLQHAIEQICPVFPVLIERSRTSIIKTLIERSHVRQIDTQPIADSLQANYLGEPSEKLSKMLRLERPEIGNMAKERKMQLDAGDAGKLHGSLLAQAMLEAPGPLREIIMECLVALDDSTLLLVAKDRTATHVLQHALTCSNQNKIFRQKMVQRFFGHISDLTVDPIGSHVVDTFWTATQDLHHIRDRIAQELLQNEATIRDSFPGRAVIRNWKLDLYKRRKLDWIAEAKGTDPERQDPKAATGSKKAVVLGKSGIELARERFAASKVGRPSGRKGIASGSNRILPVTAKVGAQS